MDEAKMLIFNVLTTAKNTYLKTIVKNDFPRKRWLKKQKPNDNPWLTLKLRLISEKFNRQKDPEGKIFRSSR